MINLDVTLIKNAKKLKTKQDEFIGVDSKEADYVRGKLAAYFEILDTIKNQLISYQVDLHEVGFNFNPDKEIYGLESDLRDTEKNPLTKPHTNTEFQQKIQKMHSKPKTSEMRIGVFLAALVLLFSMVSLSVYAEDTDTAGDAPTEQPAENPEDTTTETQQSSEEMVDGEPAEATEAVGEPQLL